MLKMKKWMNLINGLVAAKGAELDIEIICNAAVTEIDRQINEGEIEMDPSNFGLFEVDGGLDPEPRMIQQHLLRNFIFLQ